MSNITRAHQLFTELQRQYPRGVEATYSPCACGRMGSRDNRCALCITEELGTIVGPLRAYDAHEAIQEVARMWAEIREACE